MADNLIAPDLSKDKLALARKWRPKLFAQVVGQENEIITLRRALATKRLHHAYMFTGTRGVGKTTIARILAKSFNCDELTKEGEACGNCDACVQIDASQHPDVFEMDAASTTQVDRMREVLESTNYAPIAGKYKVYIIDEVHMLSKAAFNAMLKTLEEPPEHVKFILATTDPQLVPATVHSRCLRFSLRRLSVELISNHLAEILTTEKINFDKEALDIIAKQAEGSVRDALSILDEAILLNEKITTKDVRNLLGLAHADNVAQILEHIVNNQAQELIALADDIYAKGIDLENVLNELIEKIHKIQLASIMGSLDKTEFEKFKTLANVDVQLIYEIATHGRKQLLSANDLKIAFDMTLLRICIFLASQQEKTLVSAPVSKTSSSTQVATKTQAKQVAQINQCPRSEEEWINLCEVIDNKVSHAASHCNFDSYQDNILCLATKKTSETAKKNLIKELKKLFPEILEVNFSADAEKLKKKTPAQSQAENLNKQKEALIADFEKSEVMQEIRKKFPNSTIEKDKVKITNH